MVYILRCAIWQSTICDPCINYVNYSNYAFTGLVITYFKSFFCIPRKSMYTVKYACINFNLDNYSENQCKNFFCQGFEYLVTVATNKKFSSVFFFLLKKRFPDETKYRKISPFLRKAKWFLTWSSNKEKDQINKTPVDIHFLFFNKFFAPKPLLFYDVKALFFSFE